MKVVLFCGGQGLRLRDYSEQVPKPLAPLGDRPVLWHLMKYYAHFGHKEFILCLGYQGAAIKRFFLQYEEEVSNDFRLIGSGRRELFSSDIDDWEITFVDTGINSSIGERLRRVKDHLVGESVFLANYADGLSDLDLDAHIEDFVGSDAVAALLAIRPPQSYHRLRIDDEQRLEGIEPVSESDIWLNGGYFVFRPEIFDYLQPGEDLVEEPLRRLAKKRLVQVRRFEGFFAPMDTFKDKKILDERYESGDSPWVVWRKAGA